MTEKLFVNADIGNDVGPTWAFGLAEADEMADAVPATSPRAMTNVTPIMLNFLIRTLSLL
jgi:hypothetical protein